MKHNTLRTAEGFETAAKMRVGLDILIPLEFNIRNSSNTAYLKTKVDMLLCNQALPIVFTFTKGHGAGVTVGICMRMEMSFFFFFFLFDPALFPPFSLSFSPFPFAFSCAFRMLGHLSRA